MTTSRNSRVLQTFTLLIAVIFLSLPVSAQYSGNTGTYVFITDQSTVTRTGSIAGISETYPIKGQFQLTVDVNASVAYISYVDAILLISIRSSSPRNLGELFNMTELEGTVVNDLLIEFNGKTTDNTNTDITLKLTFDDDTVRLTGHTIPPPNSTDFFIFNIDAIAEKKYGGGTGEPNSPYLIYTAEQMNEIGANRNDWDKHFKLMADIDLSKYKETDFNIIGRNNNPFKGIFDGNGHTISNFSYISTSTDQIGLFVWVRGNNALIKDLGLIDPNVDARNGYGVGSLVCWIQDGAVVRNCFVRGGIVSGKRIVGGLVGGTSKAHILKCHAASSVLDSSTEWEVRSGIGSLVGVNDGTISNCSATGSVVGNQNVGGLVGKNRYSGTIDYSYSSSMVKGDNSTGGLVGSNENVVINCYATGSVTGDRTVGGLVGLNRNGSMGRITNCYSTASVVGTMYVGGLVGLNVGTITKCYSVGNVVGNKNVGGLVGPDGSEKGKVLFSFWDIQTSGQSTSAGGTGKTTVEMQDPKTFMDTGWDFVDKSDGPSDNWAEPSGGGYPILRWQFPPLSEPSTFSRGTGEADNPYIVSTAVELNSIGYNPRLMDAHFKLGNDIDVAGINFNIIGSEDFPYTGVFDGNGHTISNLSHTSGLNRTEGIGLFGYIKGENAGIRDLGLIDPEVSGRNDVGSLVGWFGKGTVGGCYVKGGSVTGTGESIGGLIGNNYYGTITNSYALEVNVTGTGNSVGGLAGNNSKAITCCYATGSVLGKTKVGGLVGNNSRTITNCYSAGNIMGDSCVGGLVGTNSSYGTITNCYSVSRITGIEHVGGLVGIGGSAHNSFWDVQASDQSTSDGGKGRTTAQMQMTSTFLSWDKFGNEGIWTIDEGNDYPRLCWESKRGELLRTQQLSDLLKGAGTGDDPYLIYTAEELNVIGLFPSELDKHFKLMADIDLSDYTGTEFNTIGFTSIYTLDIGITSPFTGVFDGNGKKIANFNHTRGLFMIVRGEIKDLGLIATNIRAETADNVGSLAGSLLNGTISNCYTQSGSISGNDGIGMLVGISYGTITNCYSSGSISGNHRVGMLVGSNSGTIINCHSSGNVSGKNSVGGLVGMNGRTIKNCYSGGDISGNNSVGGLVGKNDDTITNCYSRGIVSASRIGSLIGIGGGLVGYNHGTITNCYSIGSVSVSGIKWRPDRISGGLVGYNYGKIDNCYSIGSVSVSGNDSQAGRVGGLVGCNVRDVTDSFWDTQTSGQTTSKGGTGKTTVEMQTETTFLETGWDFVDETENGTEDIWWIDEGQDYPRLWWELVSEN